MTRIDELLAYLKFDGTSHRDWVADCQTLEARVEELERYNLGLATESERRRAALEYVLSYSHLLEDAPARKWIVDAVRKALGGSPSETSAVHRGEDIVDLLEARGDDLSRRAARYIRIKRQTEDGLERELRRMCQKSLAGESSEKASEPTCNGLCQGAMADANCPVHGVAAWLRVEKAEEQS